MAKKLTTLVTAALMGATAFAPLAIAQGTTQPAPASPGAQTEPATPPATPMAPVAPSANDSAAATTGGAYLTQQGEAQISANDYIGKSVYTAADESIGSVTNLIMEEDGGLVAAVIGVGGFLGIGAKDVAVPMDKVTMTRNAQDGTIRLTTTETAETLKAAPEFKTLEQQASDRNAAMPPAPDNTTTSATKP
ncbi:MULTISPECIES: PRC-barrel domain-containing protein [unclassified Rhizobium]|uniref:PRC-barrel domain-containing protein n=1 Tax=unclassified Rhizobium TaxID=2613769 RepID=UPI00247969E4|nr:MULTISPECIES: PRC-barrel domain-containing protein [unclassified Rhizobium]MDH7804092.1 sporulation protein YlmC with PRC-barrel domain [Rhizobium sp. AN70]